MRKVVVFDKVSRWWYETPNIDLLNEQIAEIESDGWQILSVTANTNSLGLISSYTLLIELAE